MTEVLSLTIPYFYLLHILIVAVRVGAALLFAPLWGYPGFPVYLRIILVFLVAVTIATVTPFSEDAYRNPAVIFPTEFLIGLLLSMGIRIAFAGLHFGGQMVSHFVGYSMVQTIDPTTANKSAVMSGFFAMVGNSLILTTNQHHSMLRVLASSYTAFPAGTIVGTGEWFDSLFKASSQIFVIGWRIALPLFIATMLIEVTVGFIARMQPQINTMIIAAPMKLYFGFMILGASLLFLPRVFNDALNIVVLKK